MSQVLKSGRLRGTKKDVVRYISSLEDDHWIFKETVRVNMAHVLALEKIGTVNREEVQKLLGALRSIEREKIPFLKDAEDIHVVIEEQVGKKVGPEIAGKLHTGKSRNDQVATAIRMRLRQWLLELSNELVQLETAILSLAKKHDKSLFVGYTHLQPAQPISFAHYLISVHDSFHRDSERILETYDRINRSPMGAAAIAGSSWRLDRKYTAQLLGFDGLVENSIDAVSGRDFLLETLSILGLLASDISRFCQDLVYYSSQDVGLLEIPDSYASTSSIMPQKKNPDPLEVARARAALVTGNVAAGFALMHGLPTGYNLDFQELTPLVWKSLATMEESIEILSGLVPHLKLSDALLSKKGFELTTATEVANVITRVMGKPYRGAYKIVGQAVRLASEKKKTLGELDRNEWAKLLGTMPPNKFFLSLGETLDLKKHLSLYKTIGSPNPIETQKILARRRGQLVELTKDVKRRELEIGENARLLDREALRLH